MGYDNGSGFAPAIEFDGVRVFHGDCREVLKSLPDSSVDSIVTDPPYELGFMGKKWDATGIAYDVTVWSECLRVLKPGGHVLAFGGSRTWHRLAVAVEDAGFELRDSIAWLYGSGFPKSLDVSKAIDKRAGAEREVIGSWKPTGTARLHGGKNPNGIYENLESAITLRDSVDITAPATPEAQKWQGWGTALKPAFEPIVVGRKPLVGTVAENVLEWGTGGLNIDGSRIGSRENEPQVRPAPTKAEGWGMGGEGKEGWQTTLGRWPANVMLDEYTADLLDQQSGVSKSTRAEYTSKPGDIYGGGKGLPSHTGIYGHNDSGGASRFFYVAKASRRDRNEGLDELEARIGENGNKWTDQDYRRGDDKPVTARKNFHPTVKPTQLMRYLIKLVTPPGGTVLDPFTGSGSTGKAAILDGFGFVGAELTEEYFPIIEGRLKWALENREMDETLF